MTAVPFDNSGRCNGSKSNITGRDMPMCITCGRLTMRPNAPIKGRVFATSGGLDCEHWSPNHVPTVRAGEQVGTSLTCCTATNETGRL